MAVETTITEYFLFQRFETPVFIKIMYIVNDVIFTSQITHKSYVAKQLGRSINNNYILA